GIERTLVVPGAEQPENFAAKAASEQAIHLVHAPHQPGREGLQHFPAQEALKVHTGSAARIANVGLDIEIELISDGFGEGKKKFLHRLQVGGVQLLKICEYHLTASLACFLQ